MSWDAGRWAEWLEILASERRAHVDRVWDHVVAGYGAPPPYPLVGWGDRYLWFAWNGARHYCDVELREGGKYEWFYRDRLAEEVQGDVGVDVLPERFFAYLRLVVADLEGRLG